MRTAGPWDGGILSRDVPDDHLSVMLAAGSWDGGMLSQGWSRRTLLSCSWSLGRQGIIPRRTSDDTRSIGRLRISFPGKPPTKQSNPGDGILLPREPPTGKKVLWAAGYYSQENLRRENTRTGSLWPQPQDPFGYYSDQAIRTTRGGGVHPPPFIVNS